MIRFRIDGVDKVSGAERVIEVDAPFERAAIDEASRQGLFVSNIVQVPGEPAGAAKSGASTAADSRGKKHPARVEATAGDGPTAVQELLGAATLVRGHREIPLPVELHRRSHTELMVTIAIGIVLGHVLSIMAVVLLYQLFTSPATLVG